MANKLLNQNIISFSHTLSLIEYYKYIIKEIFFRKEMNMLDYFIYILIAVVLIVLVWFIFAKVLKNKKPKEVTLKDIPIDLEALINAFGGIDNIRETEAQGSKIRIFVENDDLVKVNVLKELGASGIIQSTGKVTVILGKFSSEISGIINDKK